MRTNDFKLLLRLLLWSGLFLLFLSCSEGEEPVVYRPDDPGTTTNPVPTETAKVNLFIADYMESLYLWTSTIAWKTVYPESEPDSYDFFDKLTYTDDNWSILTDDMPTLSQEFQGVSTTFGYRLILGQYSNVDAYFAIVLYVYPGTQADLVGIKRGDIFISMNGGDITLENRMDLYNAPTIMLEKGILIDGYLMSASSLFYMEAETMYENPVIRDTVIVKGANKIGYLCYTDYTMESEPLLLETFADFKSKGVTDVVLDLRYNGGGYARTSILLSSILAPAAVAKGKELFISTVLNDAYTAYLKSQHYDTNEYFTDTLPVNMDLNRLYVLTTSNTASASESNIIGLDPYMEVVRIGTSTHGKYCGGNLYSAEDKEISNWGMYLMTYRFANKNGVTSFTGGLEPTFEVEEDYFNLYPFGDEHDPLLGKALELITGEPYVPMRSGQTMPDVKIIQAPERHGLPYGRMISTRPLPKTQP